MSYEQDYSLNTRRNFLKFLGKAGVALPVVQASSLGAGLMLARQAEATGNVPRKVIFVYIPDGTPGGATRSFTPDAALNLKDCSAPLEDVKHLCTFLSDMTIDGGGGHGNSQRVLGAFATGVRGSADLVLGDTVGSTSPIPSLRLSVRARGADPISARGFTISNDFQDNPRSAFDRLFGGAVDNSGAGTKRDNRRLDINNAALAQLKTKLGNYEKQRLEQHEAAIIKLKDDIERAASAATPEECKTASFNPSARSDVLEDVNFTDLWALQVENAILAMRCSLTNVAVIQMGTHQAEFKVSTSLDGDYHGSVHSGSYAWYRDYRAYFSARMTHLIKELQKADDFNGGKLIDSTLVVQITDMGNGDAHSDNDAPYMLAGGGNSVRKGLLPGANSHRLMDTVMQYMGQGSAPKYDASGPISGILI